MHLRLPEGSQSSRQRLRLRPAVPLRPSLRLPQVLSRERRRSCRRTGFNPPPASDGHGPSFKLVGSPLNTFFLAFLGGIFGAALMDITECALARAGIRSGVNVALVGRWFLGLTRGRLADADIQSSPSLPREAGLGWAFHFLIGGGGVALIYPAVLLTLGVPASTYPILGGLLFGLVTSLLPWFVLLPAFGWGWFGRRGPRGANAVLASPLAHIPYGLGVGAVMALGTGF